MFFYRLNAGNKDVIAGKAACRRCLSVLFMSSIILSVLLLKSPVTCFPRSLSVFKQLSEKKHNKQCWYHRTNWINSKIFHAAELISWKEPNSNDDMLVVPLWQLSGKLLQPLEERYFYFPCPSMNGLGIV